MIDISVVLKLLEVFTMKIQVRQIGEVAGDYEGKKEKEFV